jgi:ribonuclease P protein component
MGQFSFPKEERLRNKSQFQKVFRHGRKQKSEAITLFLLKNKLSQNRFGISIGKKFGSAAKRNRMKRLVREAYRLNKQKFLSGTAGEDLGTFDIVVVIHHPKHSTLGEITQTLEKLFSSAHP